MIRKDCFTPEWVDNLSERYNYRPFPAISSQAE